MSRWRDTNKWEDKRNWTNFDIRATIIYIVVFIVVVTAVILSKKNGS